MAFNWLRRILGRDDESEIERIERKAAERRAKEYNASLDKAEIKKLGDEKKRLGSERYKRFEESLGEDRERVMGSIIGRNIRPLSDMSSSAIRREYDRIKDLAERGEVPVKWAREQLKKLNNQLAAEGRYIKGTPVGKGTTYAWEKKHRARAPFFGRVESSGWDAHGLRLIDPKLRSAINKARTKLRKEAHGMAKIYENDFKKGKAKTLKADIKNAKNNWKEAVKKAKELGDERESQSIVKNATAAPQAKALDIISGALGGGGGGASAEALAIVEQMRENFEIWQKKNEELTKAKEASLNRLRNSLRTRLMASAERKAAALGLKEDSSEWHVLTAEADILATYYERMYWNFITKWIGGIGLVARGMAMGAMTWGDAMGLLWDNLKTLIFGPWLWGIALAVIQWFFVMAYIQPIAPSPFYFILPLGTGFFVFIMNVQASKQPWDWLTHFSAGLIVGFSAIIFLIAIWTPEDLAEFTGISSWLIFWVVWAILALFVGVFQLYHAGGFMTVFQISIIVLLFGYIALGPYNAYYRTVLDQVKEPFNLAWRAVANAFNDVWLLTTNPTEWYARQQVVNVKSEKPISYPKALEVTRIDAVPDTVPSGENFNIIAIIRNEGKSDIENIAVGYNCPKRSYCNATDVTVKPSVNIGKMEPGESSKITFSGFLAEMGAIKRTSRGTVELEFNYTYSTNASLFVEVASKDEISRRQYEETNVWKNVLAVDAGATARLSLNVGPQPLDERSESETLLVSVSNTREDGEIILERDKQIRIMMDETIGNLFECHGSQVDCRLPVNGTVICRIDPVESDEIVIKPYEFNTILPIFCSFATASGVEASRTGLIRAELPEYKFVVKKSKTVMVTTPLGIIYEEEGEEEEATAATEKGSALFVKIDPGAAGGEKVELWDFMLTENPRVDAGDGVEFRLDDFEYENNPGSECVVLAVDEEGALSDAVSVWYIKPGGRIRKENTMQYGIGDYIIDYGCTQGETGDFGVKYCEDPEKAAPERVEGWQFSYLGGVEYKPTSTDTDDSHCNEESCSLLEQSNGKYVWLPKYELLCADDGSWYACNVEGVIEPVSRLGWTEEYICVDTKWIKSCTQQSVPVGDLEYICETDNEGNTKWALSCKDACQKAGREGGTCASAKPADICGNSVGITYDNCQGDKGDVAVYYDDESYEEGYCTTGTYTCWCYDLDPCCLYEGETCIDGVCVRA